MKRFNVFHFHRTMTYAVIGKELPYLNMSDSDQSEEIWRIQEATRLLCLIVYPMFLLFGLIGNTLSFCVLLKRVKQSSTYTYLCTLCIADNLFLLGNCLYWIIYAATWEGLICLTLNATSLTFSIS